MNRTSAEQKETNQRIFAILIQNGATEGKHYAFDQIFSSSSEQKITAIREVLHQRGYYADSIGHHEKDGAVTYYIDAYRQMEFRRAALESESLFMLTLATKHGVLYDGWGADVEKKSPNQAPEPTRGSGAILFFQSRWPRVDQL